EDTGGLFVCTPGDDEEYADGFAGACAEAGIEAEEIGAAEALRREPRLHPGLTRAFTVPDAAVDTWRLVGACADDVERRGGTVLRRHEVVSLIVEGDSVRGARVSDARSGDEVEVRAEITVSATGAWAGKLAAMAGCDVHVRGGRGIMVALNHRLTHAVVNRCRMPSDSDILVPAHTVCVLGTTDVSTDDPDDTAVPADEVRQMLADGSEMVPHIRDARVLRAWAGIRPLYSEGDTGAATRRCRPRCRAAGSRPRPAAPARRGCAAPSRCRRRASAAPRPPAPRCRPGRRWRRRWCRARRPCARAPGCRCRRACGSGSRPRA